MGAFLVVFPRRVAIQACVGVVLGGDGVRVAVSFVAASLHVGLASSAYGSRR